MTLPLKKWVCDASLDVWGNLTVKIVWLLLRTWTWNQSHLNGIKLKWQFLFVLLCYFLFFAVLWDLFSEQCDTQVAKKIIIDSYVSYFYYQLII